MQKDNIFDQKAKTWDDNPERIKLVEKVWETISANIDFNKIHHAIDYGSGTGLLGFKAINHVESMTFCDTSDGMLDQVNNKIKYYGHLNAKTLKADFSNGQLPSKKFELIMTMLVLHHVHKLAKILANFNKLLQPGGYISIIDLENEDGSFHSDNTGVAHFGFHKQEIINLIEKNGFKVDYYSNHLNMNKKHPEGNKKFQLFALIARKEG